MNAANDLIWVRPANLDDLFCYRKKHLYRFMPARKHLHNCIWTERRNEFFGLFLIYYNHKKLETHISRANEDTSKLEPPNVIAFKRQQAHLAHKEASLTWKKGGTMGASHKTWIFNGPFDLIKLCLLSSSLAEMAWIFIFLLKTIELHRRLTSQLRSKWLEL